MLAERYDDDDDDDDDDFYLIEILCTHLYAFKHFFFQRLIIIVSSNYFCLINHPFSVIWFQVTNDNPLISSKKVFS